MTTLEELQDRIMYIGQGNTNTRAILHELIRHLRSTTHEPERVDRYRGYTGEEWHDRYDQAAKACIRLANECAWREEAINLAMSTGLARCMDLEREHGKTLVLLAAGTAIVRGLESDLRTTRERLAEVEQEYKSAESLLEDTAYRLGVAVKESSELREQLTVANARIAELEKERLEVREIVGSGDILAACRALVSQRDEARAELERVTKDRDAEQAFAKEKAETLRKVKDALGLAYPNDEQLVTHCESVFRELRTARATGVPEVEVQDLGETAHHRWRVVAGGKTEDTYAKERDARSTAVAIEWAITHLWPAPSPAPLSREEAVQAAWAILRETPLSLAAYKIADLLQSVAGRSIDTADELNPLRKRIAKGREKYPNGCTVLSLLDEAGEVAHALNKYESADRVRDEILDVASVAMRLYLGEVDRGLSIDGLEQRRTDTTAAIAQAREEASTEERTACLKDLAEESNDHCVDGDCWCLRGRVTRRIKSRALSAPAAKGAE